MEHNKCTDMDYGGVSH